MAKSPKIELCRVQALVVRVLNMKLGDAAAVEDHPRSPAAVPNQHEHDGCYRFLQLLLPRGDLSYDDG